ncbi:hypothetical protein D1007_04245 [Hordeum vulgare]|nr:hypothetical protein D1007_04245 [Hordeum vulgare]
MLMTGPKRRPLARSYRCAEEHCEEAVGKFWKGDVEKRADVEQICNWFPSLHMFVDHARGLIVVATKNEKKTLLPGDRGDIPVIVFHTAMNKVENPQDPRQRLRWYMYRSRCRAPLDPVSDLIGVVLPVSALVKQIIVHSDNKEGEK